ncbi:hypothetical protein [Hamadaea tsunoensis]|uniref:hypothetical protein n=1 Tax=Hamadaea tsunoensis TaxID=53368 RepID=UPI000424C454|nr:hypothetical protein [Hamadaea tsunoensis]
MAVEMPPWCGECDPDTRRFDLGDSERRCAQCHPYWAFGHDSVEPRRVPVGRAEQEQAARWLAYELVSLRALPTDELRRRTRKFFEAGWSPMDIVHALDFDPDGSLVRFAPSAEDPADRVQRRVLNLLSAWCDENGDPLLSPAQQAEVRRERMHSRQRAQQEKWAELAARRTDPQASVRSGARQIAAAAALRAKQMHLEARQRERAARLADEQQQRRRDEQIREQLSRLQGIPLPRNGSDALEESRT